MSRRLLPFLAAVVLLGALPGCGPANASAARADAEAALAAARKAGAAEKAPYEFTAAEAYLRESGQEAGSADFEDAAALAARAAELARKARTKALSDPAPKPAPAPVAEGSTP